MGRPPAHLKKLARNLGELELTHDSFQRGYDLLDWYLLANRVSSGSAEEE